MDTKVLVFPFTQGTDDKHIRQDILKNPQEFLKKTLSNRFSFGTDNITRQGTYKEMGFAYRLRPFLKNYVYKQHGAWHEIYALDKANARKLVYGRIDKIIEIQ